MGKWGGEEETGKWRWGKVRRREVEMWKADREWESVEVEREGG
jgi:hypothetical protein